MRESTPSQNTVELDDQDAQDRRESGPGQLKYENISLYELIRDKNQLLLGKC